MHSFIRIAILALFGLAPISALQAQGTTPAAANQRSSSEAHRRLSRFLWLCRARQGRRTSRVPQDAGSKRLRPIPQHHPASSGRRCLGLLRDRAHRHEGDCGNSRHADACLGARLDAEGMTTLSSAVRRGRNLPNKWGSMAIRRRQLVRPMSSQSIARLLVSSMLWRKCWANHRTAPLIPLRATS